MLKKRSLHILKTILYSNSNIFGDEIAELMNVSTRTIRNDIREINLELKSINCKIESSHLSGYKIPTNKRADILHFIEMHEDSTSILPITPSEREFYICMYIFFSHTPITFDNLAEHLFISKTTAVNDIKRIEKLYLKNNHIQLFISSSEGIKFVGKESSIRFLISSLLSHLYDSNLTYLKKTLKNFLKYNDELLFHLYDAIIQVLDSNKIVLTDKDLYIFILECMITIKRTKMNYPLENDYSRKNDPLIEIPFDSLERIMGINISITDRYFIDTCYSYKRLLSMNSQAINDTLSTCIIDEYLDVLQKDYCINLDDNVVLKRNLTQHINTMIKRLQYDNESDSALISDIKMAYPYPFELATAILPIIKRNLHLDISEAELSYIAIHLAVILDTNHPKLNVIVVCGSGFSTAQLLINRLHNYFSTKVNILTYCPVYKIYSLLQDYPKTDLIITTVPIEKKLSCPVLKLSPLLTNKDIETMSNYIMHYTGSSLSFEDNDYLDSNLFFVFSNNIDRNTILKTMIYELYNQSYIDSFSSFYSSVMEREKLHSTLFDSIWLPHPMSCMSKTTVMGVSLIRNGKDMKMVLLCAISPKETQKFQNLYAKITHMIEDISLFERICNVQDFAEFRKQFLQL